MADYPEAFVTDGPEGLVLHDQAAMAVAEVVADKNRHAAAMLCAEVLQQDQGRMAHFARRVSELGLSPSEVLIVLLAVDDPVGGPLVDILMPGHDWAPIRASGQKPYGRGLAMRAGIAEMLSQVYPLLAQQLAAIHGLAVLVLDAGYGLVVPAEGGALWPRSTSASRRAASARWMPGT